MSAQLTIQIIALLILVYLISRHWLIQKPNLVLILDGIIYSTVTLLLVIQSGGLASPVFYLVYLLLFGLSLLFGPLAALSLALFLSFIFLGQVNELNDFLPLFGLLLITPVAMYFSHQYLNRLIAEEKIKVLNRKKTQLQKEISTKEEDTLLWLSLAFKEELNQILDSSSILISDLSKLTPFQKENLEKIHKNAKNLMKLGENLKSTFEK